MKIVFLTLLLLAQTSYAQRLPRNLRAYELAVRNEMYNHLATGTLNSFNLRTFTQNYSAQVLQSPPPTEQEMTVLFHSVYIHFSADPQMGQTVYNYLFVNGINDIPAPQTTNNIMGALNQALQVPHYGQPQQQPAVSINGLSEVSPSFRESFVSQNLHSLFFRTNTENFEALNTIMNRHFSDDAKNDVSVAMLFSYGTYGSLNKSRLDVLLNWFTGDISALDEGLACDLARGAKKSWNNKGFDEMLAQGIDEKELGELKTLSVLSEKTNIEKSIKASKCHLDLALELARIKDTVKDILLKFAGSSQPAVKPEQCQFDSLKAELKSQVDFLPTIKKGGAYAFGIGQKQQGCVASLFFEHSAKESLYKIIIRFVNDENKEIYKDTFTNTSLPAVQSRILSVIIN